MEPVWVTGRQATQDRAEAAWSPALDRQGPCQTAATPSLSGAHRMGPSVRSQPDLYSEVSPLCPLQPGELVLPPEQINVPVCPVGRPLAGPQDELIQDSLT